MDQSHEISLSCPLPIQDYPRVLMAHGGGGRLMHQLITQVFRAAFDNPLLAQDHDSTVFNVESQRLAFTTDSYVVKPIFFPGGDIGSLAVHGTCNDLAMAGARPLYLSAAFIIEEGFSVRDLWRIALAMRDAATRAGVAIITGDTKVVERGKGDGVFINTAGVGAVEHPLVVAPRSLRPGDVIVLSGDIGRHGIAIMSAREGLAFESQIESDSASVAGAVMRLLAAGLRPSCMRDLTRGGLTSALNEVAATAGLTLEISEAEIPVTDGVRAACELLGLDPLGVACEGRFIAFMPANDAEQAIALLREEMPSLEPRVIGRVTSDPKGRVLLRSVVGINRILDLPSGEQLPRIC